MSAAPALSAHRRGGWSTLARRIDPYLDPAIGIVAAILGLTSLLTSNVDAVDPRLHNPDVLAAVATVVAAGSLAWRRSRPRAAYGVFVVGAVVVSGSFHYVGWLSLLLLLSLYSLARHGRRRDALIGLGCGVVAFVGLAIGDVPDLRPKDLVVAIALLVAAWAVGDAVRSRRELQQDQVRAAVIEERLRIARELHDVVAHSMSLIAVQAGVGAHMIRTDPAAAEKSLDVIADTSRRALEQTRSMLGMLRDHDEDGTRPPCQGLEDLPTLVADVAAAGLTVDLRRTGTAPNLDAAVSLTAYRIVQESLTNVIKHSATATATVTVTTTAGELDIEVSDPGPSRSPAGSGSSGHGLVGLEERARLIGGEVTHDEPGEGFRVHVRLPVAAR